MEYAQTKFPKARYYNPCSILGNDWAIFFGIIGPRKTGKSYGVAEYIEKQKKAKKDKLKVYWMRISESSIDAMLADNCKGIIDPDLVRKYDNDFLVHGGRVVYDVERDDTGKITKKQEFLEAIPLSKFGKLKGVGFYDKDFDGEYIIVLDEFQLEEGEKRTSFDILYNFIGMCENTVRTTKTKIKVFLLGNTLEEASSILKAFNFIPMKFGRFYLKKKRCVIDNIAPTEEYKLDRQGSIADILGGDDLSNFTGELKHDLSVLDTKHRCQKVTQLICFSKYSKDWFTVWDGNHIKRWKNNHIPKSRHIYMRPSQDAYYNPELRQTVINLFDSEQFTYHSLIDYQYFKDYITRYRGTTK